jgi:acid stress-induced BolA-like protein IbaG/YrbA
MHPDEIENLIRLGIKDCEVKVETDGLGHYQATVVSDEFLGKSRIQRHQLIYQSLGKLVGNEIHALAIKAHTIKEI